MIAPRAIDRWQINNKSQQRVAPVMEQPTDLETQKSSGLHSFFTPRVGIPGTSRARPERRGKRWAFNDRKGAFASKSRWRLFAEPFTHFFHRVIPAGRVDEAEYRADAKPNDHTAGKHSRKKY